MKKPIISLVITCFNKEKFVDRAIRSCLNQIIFNKDIEIIVVDDCSTDNSLRVISEFSTSVRLIKNSKNLGVAESSNSALKIATGKYLMRVDADDYLGNLSCETLVNILESNEKYAYAYADHVRVDVRGFKVETVRLDSKKVLYEHGAGVMMKKEVLDQVGGYDNALRNCEDYDLLYRIDQLGVESFYMPVPLYRYYIHGENITLGKDRSEFKTLVENKNGI